MTRPVIGLIAASLVEPSLDLNRNFADFAPRDLKEAVLTAGGVPLILPFPEVTALAQEVAEVAVSCVDGLILPGGADVDPTFFGEEPIRALGQTSYPRDIYEIALIKAAVRADKAIFGICRGLQVLNVAFGGTLYQDLATQNPKTTIKHQQAAPGGFPTHHVTVHASWLTEIFGERVYVNSRHHQAVAKVGQGLSVDAVADDGVVEALSSDSGNVFAVQWHPENMWQADRLQLQLFKNFIRLVSSK